MDKCIEMKYERNIFISEFAKHGLEYNSVIEEMPQTYIFMLLMETLHMALAFHLIHILLDLKLSVYMRLNSLSSILR